MKDRKKYKFDYNRIREKILMLENRILMVTHEEDSSKKNFKEIKRKVDKLMEIKEMKLKLSNDV